MWCSHPVFAFSQGSRFFVAYWSTSEKNYLIVMSSSVCVLFFFTGKGQSNTIIQLCLGLYWLLFT